MVTDDEIPPSYQRSFIRLSGTQIELSGQSHVKKLEFA